MAERFYKVFDKVLADKKLSYPEIILYGVIVRLSHNGEKKCYASNKALSDIMRCSKSSINKWLDKLSRHGYITRTLHYAEGTKHIDKRYITPLTIYTTDLQGDISADDMGICCENDIGYTEYLQEGIPPFYQNSKKNLDREISKRTEEDNLVKEIYTCDGQKKSNNFFLNLAIKNKSDELF